jgi:ribonuclease-3 family protein
MSRGLLRSDGEYGLQEVSVQALAHVGDAVYELMARTWFCMGGATTAKSLHKGAVSLVSAPAQAEAAARILPALTDEELAVFKRGRNAHANATPRGSTLDEYHAATGLEALFGHLYLTGCKPRLDELFALIVDRRDTEDGDA